MTLVVREIQQRGQHATRQLLRYRRHPIEGLVQRQTVEHFTGALTDEPLHFLQILRCHHTLDRTALHIVLGRVHRNEHLHGHPFREVAQHDERLGGKQLVMLVHEQNVLVARYRPERAKGAIFLVMHRCLVTQPLEIGAPLILPVQEGVAGVDVLERQRVDIGNGRFHEVNGGTPRADNLLLRPHQHLECPDLQVHRHHSGCGVDQLGLDYITCPQFC